MKTYKSIFQCLIAVVFIGIEGANGQGTITFNDANPNWDGTYYVESGVAFQLVVPQGSFYDYLGILYGAGNTPRNGTPFMWWFRQNNPHNYVSLSMTDGLLFGLTSVDLADPNAPSLSPVSISFIGHLSGGGTLTNTFTTPGNGATTFANYTFTAGFSSPVFTHVDILAPKWAMDNLVFTVVPEPGTCALLGLGLFALGFHQLKQRRKI